jgi:hypothetical protein
MIGFASRERFFATSLMACLVSAATAQGAAPQASSPPDFSSNQVSWAGIGGGELLPVPGSPRPVTQDPRYKYTPNGQGAQPTFRIGDITNPNLKQWARDVMKKDNDEVLAGKIGYTARSSCKPGGVPGFIVMGGGAMFFVQSRAEVTMIFDGNAEVRHIHLNVPHAANPKPSWYGDSVGHYEGDTLVIDTIGLNDKTFVDAYRTPHTEKLHVTERWRLVENGDKLEVLMTVDDPDTFNQPWQAMRRYQHGTRTLVENICAENNLNFGLFDYHIPQADKPDF